MMEEKYSSLQAATKAISSVCDGAVKHDGTGYNSRDADFMHSLCDRESWTFKQAEVAHRILKKYSKQLFNNHGIRYSEIPTPTKLEHHFGIRPREKPTIDIEDDKFVIRFEYENKLVKGIKYLVPYPNKSKWNPNTKSWHLNANKIVVDALKPWSIKNNFVLTEEASDRMDEIIAKNSLAIKASAADSSNLIVDGLGGDLYPFQAAGVEYAKDIDSVLIGDEMGLGKTMQALAILQLKNAFPALVVCPAGLKYNWEREASKWLPERSVSVINGGKVGLIPETDVVIINYDILNSRNRDVSWVDAFNLMLFRGIVLDESHYIKNHKAKRTKAVSSLADKIKTKILLTGTPILNRPVELVSQLEVMGKLDDFGGFWGFVERYCDAHQGSWGWDFSGSSNLKELNNSLRGSCFVRRRKEDVLSELPKKQHSMLPVKITNQKEYKRAEKAFLSWVAEQAMVESSFLESIKDLSNKERKWRIKEHAESATAKAKRAEKLVKIEKLKQLSAKGKLKAAIEWIESFLETDGQLVVFATHRFVVDALKLKFPDSVTIQGGDSAINKQLAVDRFQNGKAPLLIGNTKAAGLGITLTAASNVVFIELGWTPAEHDQAEDRLHRIGQESSVNCWYFTGVDTVDKYIYDLLQSKRSVVDEATDGESSGYKMNILNTLIKKMSAK